MNLHYYIPVFMSQISKIEIPKDRREKFESEYGYSLLSSFEYKHIPVLRFRSNQTGITIVLAQVDSPLVCGNFGVATEALDDDGCPHVLVSNFFF